MKIIGINYLSESSVALIENGEVKFAISQERLNRIKNWYGNPYKAINFVLKMTKNKIRDIDIFATHGSSALEKEIPNKINFDNKIQEIKFSKLNTNQKKKQIFNLKKRLSREIKVKKRTLKNLENLKKRYKKLEIFDHHDAHAASAYFYSGWKKCTVLTIDGWGDHFSSKFYETNNGILKNLSKSSSIDSLGYFYGSITKLLGFKPHRHEGKILGLAAYGNYKKAYKYISKMISYDYKNKSFKGNYENGLYIANFDNKNLNFLNRLFSSADIAAATQKRIEEVIIDFLQDNLNCKTNLALAGGVFANVKINQKISELKNVKEIFVYPNMGDGGLAVGCGILAYNKFKKFKPRLTRTMYLGSEYSNKEILNTLKKNKKLEFSRIKNPEKFLAQKLHQGKVVACFQGRMEFGPRALGNRSILVSACDNLVNKWLNKKLKRTEFMPFAPITLDSYANQMYHNLKPLKKAVQFMTSTVKCKKEIIDKSPASVHIDKTARPQIIDKKTNPRIYKILKEYKTISGIPNLINTSFNVHEEPIVCSPSDALRAFKTSDLDYLFIGDYIVYK
tara:strand:- start:1350 stop:3038 length:1689 start_codon:yes stop_codon:yes gene_type:complete